MNKALYIFFLILISASFFSCGKIPGFILKTKESFKTAKPAQTIQIDKNDQELERIAQKARETLPQFFRHLLNPKKGESGFRVKYPISTENKNFLGMEQIWLSEITFKDGVYYGVLDNAPLYNKSLKKGDTTYFDISEISDWMYIYKKKIIGGRSIKYLLEKINEKDRSKEQREILLMFN